MKQKDIPVVIVVIFVSALISLFVSKAIFASPKNRHQTVDVVQSISTDFPAPDSAYFNKNSIDPTQPITIGQNNNTNPFSSTSQ